MAKAPWQSKTLIVNLIMALAALFFPGVGEYVKAHPELVMSVFAGLNIALRFLTKGAIQIGD